MAIHQRPADDDSPLRGRYLVQNPRAVAFLKSTDAFLAACVARGRPRTAEPAAATHATVAPRILLMNGAHLGDVLLSTSVLPRVQEAFPHSKLGFVAGSWAAGLFANDSRIDRVHVVDHWKLNRSKASHVRKIMHYLQSRSKALREIRSMGYDVAIDLYFYFPNNILLAWQAGIPHRVGFVSGGFGPLLTEPHEWRFQRKSVAQYMRELVDRPAALGQPAELRTTLAGPDAPLASLSDMAGRYVVLHIGSGSEIKKWPADRWRTLAKALIERGHFLVFTGAGTAESAQVAAVANGLDSNAALNLAGTLDWQQFLQVVKFAAVLIGVDSVAGHVAANFSVPGVTIATGIVTPELWRPLSHHAVVLSGDVPCAPCNRSNGCAHMTCISQVSVDDVLSASIAAIVQRQTPGPDHAS